MEWLEQFKDEILALKDPKSQTMWGVTVEEAMENPEFFSTTIKPILEPLTDGTVDEGDLDQVAASIWEQFGDEFIAGEKAYIHHIVSLLPLYHRLLFATPDEWAAYHRVTVEATFGNPMILRLLSGLSPVPVDEDEPIEEDMPIPPGS